jgi:hypothetical protein
MIADCNLDNRPFLHMADQRRTNLGWAAQDALHPAAVTYS